MNCIPYMAEFFHLSIRLFIVGSKVDSIRSTPNLTNQSDGMETAEDLLRSIRKILTEIDADFDFLEQQRLTTSRALKIVCQMEVAMFYFYCIVIIILLILFFFHGWY